jgi:hypothetical protein
MVEETRIPGENPRSSASQNYTKLYCVQLFMDGTDKIARCISTYMYNMITTNMATIFRHNFIWISSVLFIVYTN